MSPKTAWRFCYPGGLLKLIMKAENHWGDKEWEKRRWGDMEPRERSLFSSLKFAQLKPYKSANDFEIL